MVDPFDPKDTRLKSVIRAERHKLAKKARVQALREEKKHARAARLAEHERSRIAARVMATPAAMSAPLLSPEGRVEASKLAQRGTEDAEFTTLDGTGWTRLPSEAEVERFDGDDDDPIPDSLETVQRLPPVAALRAPLALPKDQTKDPVLSYLSRYTSQNSRIAMASSLNIVARLLTGREADPRTVPWHEVRYVHAQLVRTGLVNAGYSWASVNRHLLALRGITKECWRLGLTDHDVYLRIAEVEPMKSSEQVIGHALSNADLAALIGACDDSPLGRRSAAIVALTAGGGLRRSEVCSVDVADWTFSERQLKVLGKGAKWRTVYLSPAHAARIESWLEVRGREAGTLLCAVTRQGKPDRTRPLTSSGLYVMLQRLGEAAKIKSFTPHDLRRTFITRLLEKGADLLTVSKLAGHNSVQTTMRYDKRGEATKRSAVDLLDDEPETTT